MDGLISSFFSSSSVLAIGFVLGLKHAIEADHLAAVTTIVSERKSIFSASIVGGLWGIGHTIALLATGAVIIFLRVEVGKRTELILELCVALMLAGLGANALRKLVRGHLHAHFHRHGGRWHFHPHLHRFSAQAHEHQQEDLEEQQATHHGFRMHRRPILVGMVHGLAGSAALMLLVIATIESPLIGLGYIAVFGVGSIGGMVLMSAIVGLPIHFTARRLTLANVALRWLAAAFSLGLGLFMVYEISSQ